MTTFHEAMKQRRIQLGLTLRELARTAHLNAGHLSRLERGNRQPSDSVADALDAALCADGELTALHQPDPQARLYRESERLAVMLAGARPGEVVSGLDGAVDQLAVDYLATPGPGLMAELSTARREAMDALTARRLRHHDQVRDLTRDVGYLSGILAYAALDGGNPDAALKHAEAAWEAADRVDSSQLRAWVRGTESLILRFKGDYTEALNRANDGLQYATTGTAKARLLAGVGQCHANMSDAPAARRALNAAEDALDSQRGMDEVNGLFTFSQAKLYYYSGSTLIWLEGGADAKRARRKAHDAIAMWKTAGPERSVADEALAHVYAATGSLQVRDLEEAVADLEPILSLPPERRISWIVKRMDRIMSMLGQPPFVTDPAAIELRDQIREYSA